ncbi:MAG: DUF4112 domain-containing protein [Rhodospirillales bacterium]|nr:DUF4112 domain-containing protein [Rhodospirillales bacterium]
MDDNAEIRKIEDLADLLDSRFRVPGTGIRFGLDSLLGLLPGIGDGATAIAALYVVLRAHQLGVPKNLVLRMLGNVGLDAVLGSIPLVGDLFDLGFKANRRNVALLKRHLSSAGTTPRHVRRVA